MTRLSPSLQVLASEHADADERNQAAASVLAIVRTWGPQHVSRAVPCKLDDDDLEEVLQHLLIRCATGTSRFLGSTEAEAYAWCTRVLDNKARDLCRQKRRVDRGIGTTDADQDEGRTCEPAVEPSLESLLAIEVRRQFEAIAEEFSRLHRRQDIDSLRRSLRCHIEARMGAEMDEQIETYGFEPDEARSPESAARARQRVYQYRSRGRVAGCEALSSLVAQARFAPEEVAYTQRLLGCDTIRAARPGWPSGVRGDEAENMPRAPNRFS